MSKQLTMGDVLELVKELKEQGMTLREIKKKPIYIGDDDELNGIHCGWYRQMIDPANEEDADLIEMINEDSHNFEVTGKSILIS